MRSSINLRLAQETGNLDSARAILADVERYGGESAGLVQWAQLVLDRAAREQPSAQDGRAA